VSRSRTLLGLFLVLLLGSCQASGIVASSIQASDTEPPPLGPSSVPTGTATAFESHEALARPAFLYLLGHALLKQVGNGKPELIAEVPTVASVHAAVVADKKLFILDEQGIIRVNLTDGKYERLVNFDMPALAGQLIASDRGSKIIYSAVIEDLSTQSSFATIIGAIEPEHKTEFFRSYQATWVNLLGLTEDKNGLVLQPVGQDPEFDRIWLLDMSKSDEVKEVFLQGIGTLVASLSPDAQFLATMGQIPGTGVPTDLEAVLSLYNLSSLDRPTHRDSALPKSPSHFKEVVWSGDSQKIYFLLLPGKSWEEPSTTYGLWSFDVSTDEMSPVASISEVDFVLSRISSDGNWILLTHLSSDGALLVHIPTGKSQPFNIQRGVLMVEMSPGVSP
jgi:hypothetical protein